MQNGDMGIHPKQTSSDISLFNFMQADNTGIRLHNVVSGERWGEAIGNVIFHL